MDSKLVQEMIDAAVMAERERIAVALEGEAELSPCKEDGSVLRSAAWLVRADFSYEEAERLEVVSRFQQFNAGEKVVKEWLLMKRGLYYGPNNCGYTGIKDKAGRYSLEEMNESVKAGNGVTGIHESGAPDFTTACFDDLARDHLIKQRDALLSTLKGIAEYCSTDHGTLSAIARLATIRNTADRAVAAYQQSAAPEK